MIHNPLLTHPLFSSLTAGGGGGVIPRRGDEGVAADGVIVDLILLSDLGLPQSAWPSLQARQQQK